MGMDVYSRDENNEAYFRASIFSWPNILEAMKEAGFYPPREWSFNDGAGLETHEECVALAEMIEQHWFPDGEPVDPDVEAVGGATSHMGETVLGFFHSAGVTVVGDEMPKVRSGHLWRWCQFLRKCGGFKIY
jgi:hypothetical protein